MRSSAQKVSPPQLHAVCHLSLADVFARTTPITQASGLKPPSEEVEWAADFAEFESASCSGAPMSAPAQFSGVADLLGSFEPSAGATDLLGFDSLQISKTASDLASLHSPSTTSGSFWSQFGDPSSMAGAGSAVASLPELSGLDIPNGSSMKPPSPPSPPFAGSAIPAPSLLGGLESLMGGESVPREAMSSTGIGDAMCKADPPAISSYFDPARAAAAPMTSQPALNSLPTSAAVSSPGGGGMFETGQVVVVMGLQSKPHLNGSKGKIVCWDSMRGRYNVSLNDGDVLSLKPANLSMLPAGCNPAGLF